MSQTLAQTTTPVASSVAPSSSTPQANVPQSNSEEIQKSLGNLASILEAVPPDGAALIETGQGQVGVVREDGHVTLIRKVGSTVVQDTFNEQTGELANSRFGDRRDMSYIARSSAERSAETTARALLPPNDDSVSLSTKEEVAKSFGIELAQQSAPATPESLNKERKVGIDPEAAKSIEKNNPHFSVPAGCFRYSWFVAGNLTDTGYQSQRNGNEVDASRFRDISTRGQSLSSLKDANLEVGDVVHVSRVPGSDPTSMSPANKNHWAVVVGHDKEGAPVFSDNWGTFSSDTFIQKYGSIRKVDTIFRNSQNRAD
jgi:hypothetical protein